MGRGKVTYNGCPRHPSRAAAVKRSEVKFFLIAGFLERLKLGFKFRVLSRDPLVVRKIVVFFLDGALQ
jgi:hypothetical protein